jgi:hypothetical protein
MVSKLPYVNHLIKSDEMVRETGLKSPLLENDGGSTSNPQVPPLNLISPAYQNSSPESIPENYIDEEPH